MNHQQQKVLLLSKYFRYARSFVCGQPPGLEQYIPRISTPTLDSFLYTDDKELFDRYELFRTWVGKPPGKLRVRGMRQPPSTFFSGNIIREMKVAEKVTIAERYRHFKRVLREMFDKLCYKIFKKTPCDDRMCPPSCDCEKVKSLLNKTTELFDDADEDEEIATRKLSYGL